MPRRCVVLVPYATHIEPICERGLRELEKRGLEVRRHASSAAIDRTRSELASQALRDGFDELFWIDSDIAFEPDDVARLRSHALPIAAGLYAKKGARSFAVHLEPGTRELQVGDGGGLVRVRYVGAGFLCTRREVYADLALPACGDITPYFLPMVIRDETAGYWYLGEDYAFGERARKAGHATIVDTAIRLGHVGTYVYGWEDVGQAIPRVTGAKFANLDRPEE